MTGEPVISVGKPTITSIPKGEGWTGLVEIHPDDGRTSIEAQLATSLSATIANRPTLCEVQIVRVRSGFPDDPTAQDDRSFTFDLVDGKVRIRRRQNWLYVVQGMRTYSDEALRIFARHPGPVAISLSWVVKAVLVRPEAGRA